jgi:glutathione peroxidase
VKDANSIHDFKAVMNDGTDKNLGDYKGKVLLIVNVASQCGMTPQYKGLQALYGKYRAKGLEVLGFPCDQFGHQEPGSDGEIKAFCETNYGVTFPLFRKIEVNGENAHPLYKYLEAQAPASSDAPIKWNFTKFLVDADGKFVRRFEPPVTPETIDPEVGKLLAR